MRRLIAVTLICVASWFAGSAVAEASSAAQSSPGDWTYTPPSAQKSVEIGNFYLRKKDYRGALSRFLEAVRTNPDYAPAYQGLGKTYEATGEKQQALEAYLKYLEELPSDNAAAHAKDVHRAIARLKRQLTPAQIRTAEKKAVILPR